MKLKIGQRSNNTSHFEGGGQRFVTINNDLKMLPTRRMRGGGLEMAKKNLTYYSNAAFPNPFLKRYKFRSGQ